MIQASYVRIASFSRVTSVAFSSSLFCCKIRTASQSAFRAHSVHITPTSRSPILKGAANWTDAFSKNKAQPQQKMGASWSASSGKETADPILWTSIDSQPTTKLYDAFQVSVGLSEDATSRLEKGATWLIDFEVDVAHLQKRFELCQQPADAASVQRLVVEGHKFRKIVEAGQISNDDVCNICAIHFKLESNGQELGQFCLVADIFREGMVDCPAGELSRKVYGTTKQKVSERLT